MDNFFEIPKCNFSKLEKKIKQLQRTAKKLNVETPQLEVIGERVHKWKDNLGRHSIVYIQVKVYGLAPKLNGWIFVGTIEHNDTGNIIRTIPTFPEELSTVKYRNVKTSCDHCQTNRYRKETFLVFNDTTKKLLQVGRSCLKDFIGHASPEYYATICQWIIMMEEKTNEEYFGLNNSEYVFEISEVLSAASMYISKNGYVPASSGRDDVTSAFVRTWLNTSKADWKDKPNPSERDIDLAKNVLDFINNLDKNKSLNDFEFNMNVTSKKEYLNKKDIGLVTYMVEHYRREVEKIEKFKKQQNKDSTSNYVGDVKERLNLELTFVKGFNFGWCDYSNTSIVLYKFKDVKGNIFCWKTTKDLELYAGDIVKMKGTVKEHKTYNDIHQTIITRCRIDEIKEKNTTL